MDGNLTYLETLASGSGGSEYTETIVNISSAQILAMGTTPIELLPAAGVGKYYDIDKIIFEVDGNTIDYTYSTLTSIALRGALIGEIFPASILERSFSNVFIQLSNNALYNSGVYNYTEDRELNLALTLTTDDSENPILGNGILRIKIYHKTIIFGA